MTKKHLAGLFSFLAVLVLLAAAGCETSGAGASNTYADVSYASVSSAEKLDIYLPSNASSTNPI